MRPVHVIFRIGCAGLLLAGTSAPAVGLDQIGQTGAAATKLGQRIAAQSSTMDATRGTDRYWNAVVIAIIASDPATDARTDTRSGQGGLMTYANDTTAERFVAPDVRCLDRSEPERRSVFHFAYSAPLSAAAGKALLAFDTYARAYNAQALAAGALVETSCMVVEN